VAVQHQVADRDADGALPSRRRALLTAFVDEQGQATVTELAEAFKVSADTVRRDLDLLAQRGAVSRTYGGAVTVTGLATTDTPFSDRSSVHREEKQRIAAAAAERIADGETVILNGGTTTQAVAHALGQQVDRHDDQQDQNADRTDFLVNVEADYPFKFRPNPARSDKADDR